MPREIRPGNKKFGRASKPRSPLPASKNFNNGSEPRKYSSFLRFSGTTGPARLSPNMRRGEYAILLAEDDENDIVLTKRAFKKAGLDSKLFVVRNGEEAIKYLAGEGPYADRDKHPLPNLVITDLKMPKKNGSDLIHWIRKNPRLRGLQVFVLSSAQEKERAVLAVAADAYLRKSADGDELEDMVQGLASFFEDLQSSLQKSSISFTELSENDQ